MKPYTWEETKRRRVDTMEWHDDAMTEEQRLEGRRFEAYFAFETMPDAEFHRRNLSFGQFGGST